MTPRTIRSPLTWLGALLVVYLGVPVVLFLVRLGRSSNPGFGTMGLWGALRVSIVSASISTALIAFFGIPLAYGLARSRGRLSGLIGVVVQLPLALPPIMSGILLIYLFGPYTFLGRLFHQRLTNSIIGVILAQTFVSAPFLIIAARSAFANVDPALEEVAATLGHRPLARFLLVSLPVAAPGIGAGMLLTWLRAFGEYGATVLLAYHPYTLPVYVDVQFSGFGLATTQAPTALALAVAVVAIILSRQHRPRRRPGSSLPSPQPPAASPVTPLSFDLDVRVGTFRLVIAHESQSHRLAILGPSGSGKTITLRSLAGLLGPGVGSVVYGGEVVDGVEGVRAVPTERRRVGYVPQGLGLFPHRTVWQQLTFATDADLARAAWWLDTLHLRGLEDRFPDELSGGQRQRVSLAQALSHNPRLVLLDEPFSALDAPVRQELRRQVRRLQYDAGLSTVLVTHDPEEAALLADEIIVIADGRVLQAGTQDAVYRRPASPQVAALLGMQNFNSAGVGSPTELRTGGVTIDAGPHGLAVGTEVVWCVRPEHIDLSPTGRYPAEILDVANLGAVTALTVGLGEGGDVDLHVRTISRGAFDIGARCRIDIEPDAILVWPASPDPESNSSRPTPGGTVET